ncbi:MAG: xanthine dehydrogenase family protein [Thermomicrobiales bacterium]|nr:xanthine dehydrogenase family protein [Thermomicrobiales bacterium]
MLHLKVVFAGRPSARIRSIDASEALAAPGVVAVLTAADVPYNAFGLIERDQPVLCSDVVRFQGDKVALVVAESAEAATIGARRVRVDYDDLPGVFDPFAALEPGAPLVHAARGTNLLHRLPIRKGDVAAGFAAADLVLEGEFTTTWQEHAFLQPEAGVAWVDDDGRVVVESAGQWLHEDRKQIANMLELAPDRVVIRYAAIGGAFGGREDLSVQHLLALAAWKLRRPVAIVWSREESIVGHHKRHPMTVRCRWGATNEGRLTAVAAEVTADGGAYASTSEEVTKVATLFATGCYAVDNVAIEGRVAYTNNVPAGAFRGFGAPQAHFASEVMMTRLAHGLGLDPVEFRRRNIYREGDREPTRNVLPAGVSALPVLNRCAEEVARRGWAEEAARANIEGPSWLRRGVGIAAGHKNLGYSFGFAEQSTATIELWGRGEPEGALLRSGAADVGQGVHLAMRQIAAETLGLDLQQVALIADDSAETPNAGSSSASRQTVMSGRAVHDAAVEALAKYHGSDEERVVATVQYCPPATTPLAADTGEGVPNYCYGYAAQGVEVEVDTLSGKVRVIRVASAHDVGRAINMQQVEGQIEGCVAQAIGYALMEDLKTRDGRILTSGFSTYLLPTALDAPEEIVPIVLELADPLGPFGARGVAELPLVPFTAAVAAAIHDAVGVWLTDQPFTPERVLAALEG